MSTRVRLLSALSAAAFALTVSSAATAQDAKCQDAMNKFSRNVGNQEQKKNRKCVKDGSGDITTCVDTDAPKATDKATKVHELFQTGGKCETVPGVGVNNAGTPDGQDAVDAVIENAGDILRDVFGDPIDDIAAGDKCLDAIAKRAGKAYDSGLKGYRKCVKSATKLAPLDQTTLNNCIASGVNDAKVAKFMDEKLPNDITKKCAAFPPEGADDGDCASCTDGASCAACVDVATRCAICEAANAISNGTADCDTLDDGNANASCGSGAPVCPVAAGRYTITQNSGGTLQVASIGPFPFPAGGTVVQDVDAGNANCVHNTVVPASGGFSAPVFCIPGLNFTVEVVQAGCGVGRIDSNGGSDFTVTEVGDTSDTNGPCNLPHAGCTNGSDGNVRVDITVGDGAADTCGGGGTGNAIVAIPVQTTTWLDAAFECPDADGQFDMGSDTLVLQIPQILDFTTDTADASWSDLDADGCTIAGAGPAAGLSDTGVCIDFGTNQVTTVAAGTIGSDSSPLFDLTFVTDLPNTLSGPAAHGGATCGTPPVIDFAGTDTRCIVP